MPFNDPRAALTDILENIVLAKAFVKDISFDEFVQNRLYYYAVTRALEIISEASRKLPGEMKDRHATIPWKQIAGSGNIFRHDYEDVLERIVWDTVHMALDPLEDVVRQELS
ncbi:MAG: DUF86 domain-containing protein [Alphaproteobacteria bacterium]|nr:DUF86 domain-containing protein [Alphaproteobacteria bacterium]